MATSFGLASNPFLHFGTGKLSILPASILAYGKKILLVTGSNSFSHYGDKLATLLHQAGIAFHRTVIDKEPSPQIVDDIVLTLDFLPEVVVAIGGGSVLDAGKAISAMLPLREPVEEYLEGVGIKEHPGSKTPFIAVPTTSGTGSEATKNAVLSQIGKNGYKRSLRHDKFVPDIAIVDPELTASCSHEVTAYSGMDAFTQLLESFVSTSANPITDALSFKGLSLVARSLWAAYKQGDDLEARADMALAAYLSGITLANAGLGLVHGFASPIGGFYRIPHGVICSSLMGPANRFTVQKIRSSGVNHEALTKYEQIGRLFYSGTSEKSNSYLVDLLLDKMDEYYTQMNIPRLRFYGVGSDDFSRIAKATGNKNNPIALTEEERIQVLSLAV